MPPLLRRQIFNALPLRLHRQTHPQARHLNTTPPNPLPTNPPTATSTSAAQPFSTPLTPSPKSLPNFPSKASSDLDPATQKSSVPPGVPLRGLSYIKNQEPILAREDHEYPDWLWGILSKKPGEEGEGEGGEGDAFAKSKKQRRLASKTARARANLSPSPNNPNPNLRDNTLPHLNVPLDEQSIDLLAGEGKGREALEKRAELTDVMRVRRRRGIKEGNYLKGMR